MLVRLAATADGHLTVNGSIPPYTTGDAGTIDADGYLSVMARTDDVINVAGHRLSTGAFEEVLLAHAAVAECAVVGAADEIKGQVRHALSNLKKKPNRSGACLACLPACVSP